MTFNSDEIGGRGDEVAVVFYTITSNCPAHSFCFGLLRVIGANDLNVSCFFVFVFGMVGDE